MPLSLGSRQVELSSHLCHRYGGNPLQMTNDYQNVIPSGRLGNMLTDYQWVSLTLDGSVSAGDRMRMFGSNRVCLTLNNR